MSQPPDFIEPMLAKPGDLPRRDEDYGFEYKWDGMRVVIHHTAERLKLWSRNGRDVTKQFPELASPPLAGRTAVLDGEIVALRADDGRPDFGLLQQRMHIEDAELARMRSRAVPAVCFVFDLLWLGGRDMMRESYIDRRSALSHLDLIDDQWKVPNYHRDSGAAMVQASMNQGLEGIMAKRLGSAYQPGRRSGDWVKIKHSLRQEFVVGGWKRGEGSRTGRIGSLLLGYYEDDELRYAGRVGSGITDDDQARLLGRLEPLQVEASPFEGRQPPSGDHVFVKPRLVVEVEFRGWTHQGTVRQGSFQGLRVDKAPEDVVLETDEQAAPRAWQMTHAV